MLFSVADYVVSKLNGEVGTFDPSSSRGREMLS